MMSRRVLPALMRVTVCRRLPCSIPKITVKRFSDISASHESFVPGINKGKTSTGYVGLAVQPDWYNVMLDRFQALLDKMEASDMPSTAQYRIDVTKWCNYVMAQAKANPEDPEAVEDACRMGQVEELIEMAEDEMVALDAYLEVRMWEMVGTPEVVFEPDPSKDPMGPDGNADTAEKIRQGMQAK